MVLVFIFLIEAILENKKVIRKSESILVVKSRFYVIFIKKVIIKSERLAKINILVKQRQYIKLDYYLA